MSRARAALRHLGDVQSAGKVIETVLAGGGWSGWPTETAGSVPLKGGVPDAAAARAQVLGLIPRCRTDLTFAAEQVRDFVKGPAAAGVLRQLEDGLTSLDRESETLTSTL